MANNRLGLSLVLGMILIPAAESIADPVLGNGYHSWRDEQLSSQCLNSGTIASEGGEGWLNWGQQITQYQLKRELNLDVSADVKYGNFSGKASAKYYQAVYEDELSASYTFQVKGINTYYTFYANSITPLSPVGQAALSQGKFYDACGDKFVRRIATGASLYVTLKYNFRSASDKQTFKANVSVNYGLFQGSVDYSSLSEEIQKNTSLTIVAYQEGGNVLKLTQILGTLDAETGVYAASSCNVKDLAACNQMISSITNYAQGDFVSDAGISPAIYEIDMQEYRFAGLSDISSLGPLPTTLTTARTWLAGEQEKWAGIRHRAEFLLKEYELALDTARKDDLQNLLNEANANLFYISAVGYNCYREIDHEDQSICINSYDAIRTAFSQAQPIDQSRLIAPSATRVTDFVAVTTDSRIASTGCKVPENHVITAIGAYVLGTYHKNSSLGVPWGTIFTAQELLPTGKLGSPKTFSCGNVSTLKAGLILPDGHVLVGVGTNISNTYLGLDQRVVKIQSLVAYSRQFDPTKGELVGPLYETKAGTAAPQRVLRPETVYGIGKTALAGFEIAYAAFPKGFVSLPDIHVIVGQAGRLVKQ